MATFTIALGPNTAAIFEETLEADRTFDFETGVFQKTKYTQSKFLKNPLSVYEIHTNDPYFLQFKANFMASAYFKNRATLNHSPVNQGIADALSFVEQADKPGFFTETLPAGPKTATFLTQIFSAETVKDEGPFPDMPNLHRITVTFDPSHIETQKKELKAFHDWLAPLTEMEIIAKYGAAYENLFQFAREMLKTAPDQAPPKSGSIWKNMRPLNDTDPREPDRIKSEKKPGSVLPVQQTPEITIPLSLSDKDKQKFKKRFGENATENAEGKLVLTFQKNRMNARQLDALGATVDDMVSAVGNSPSALHDLNPGFPRLYNFAREMTGLLELQPEWFLTSLMSDLRTTYEVLDEERMPQTLDVLNPLPDTYLITGDEVRNQIRSLLEKDHFEEAQRLVANLSWTAYLKPEPGSETDEIIGYLNQ